MTALFLALMALIGGGLFFGAKPIATWQASLPYTFKWQRDWFLSATYINGTKGAGIGFMALALLLAVWMLTLN